MNIALAASILLLFSCNQSPLFYNISKETPPKDPVVAGTPSKIVESSVSGAPKLYVANGRVWEYDGSTWKQTAGQPSGDFKEVAATTGTGAALYALSVEGTGCGNRRLASPAGILRKWPQPPEQELRFTPFLWRVPAQPAPSSGKASMVLPGLWSQTIRATPYWGVSLEPLIHSLQEPEIATPARPQFYMTTAVH